MSIDLFDFATEKNSSLNDSSQGGDSHRESPLAYRMRPLSLDEFCGQEKILGEGKPLRKWIETDRVPSLIFWGPPGCGKTTLARLIAKTTKARFESISAVLSGVKDIKEIVSRAKETRKHFDKRTILFVDEVHRFNKSQQDSLLPHVEAGTVFLIGATTENPSFELNSALLSRVRVMRFEGIGEDNLTKLLKRALLDSKRGLGGFFNLTDDAFSWLSRTSDGDARRALTSLENIALFVGKNNEAQAGSGQALLDIEDVKKALESAMERQPLIYDKSGEEHYNVISAFIKSLRDSDPHAALYYLARMLESGEDPMFVARRMAILASEDIGNADPRAIMVAMAVKEACEFIGMPECRINLAQGVTYLALAPKSNASYVGISDAIKTVRETGALTVPMHLRNAVTGLMRKEGYGQGYNYAHSNNGGTVKQTHLPDKLLGRKFYYPKSIGLEIKFQEKLKELDPLFEK